MVLILGVMLFLLNVFSMLCRTNKVDEYLMDTKSQSYGWSYETLSEGKAAEVTPEFTDEYTMILPGEPAEAVKITRVFTETLPFASLELRIYGAGVEVFVDKSLLYSDFQGGERNEEGFLLPKAEELEQIAGGPERGLSDRTVRFSLPEDYTGKKLTVITYFAEGRGTSSPVYPLLGNYETVYAGLVTGLVLSIAVLVLCAIFTVLISLVFVLDIPNGNADFRILLLALSFMLQFLGKAYNSFPGTLSILSEQMNLSFLKELYVAPLYLYLALHLTGWRKYVMSSGVLVWFLYEGTRMFLNVRAGELPLLNRNGLGALVLAAAVAAALFLEYACREYRGKSIKKEKNYNIAYWILLAVVVALCVLYEAQEWGGNVGMYISQVIFSARHKGFFPIVYLFTNICGIMTMVMLVVEFIRRNVREKEMLLVMEERNRFTLEGYNRMLKAEEAANSVRHETRHHMMALLGILKEGKKERACDYIISVTEELDKIPEFRYSQNILVNVIAGNYLDRAKTQGIKVEYSLPVPKELKIADGDLSVFLTNMLENALEACERMPQEQERYIRVKMHVNGNFLFIGCVNSRYGETEGHSHAAGNTERKEHRRHGYGMAAMNRIAKEYGSILKVEQSPSEFSVKTNLCLNQREG